MITYDNMVGPEDMAIPSFNRKSRVEQAYEMIRSRKFKLYFSIPSLMVSCFVK
jgi:hypothetical protein